MTRRPEASSAAFGTDPRRRVTPWPWILLVLVLAATATARWRRLPVPLERDEGEYALAGQLILDGEPPYRLVYSMKFPGTYLAYAAILETLGQTPRGIHGGLLAVHLAATGLVFLLARAAMGDRAAVAAAAAYTVLSVGEATLGMAAHATHFVVLPALAGLLLLRRGLTGSRFALFASGACFGLAISAKQNGLVFLAFALAYAAWDSWRRRARCLRAARDLGLVAAGATVPLVGLGAWLAATGVFGRFWLWTIEYARAYGGEMSLAAGWEKLRLHAGELVTECPVLWLIAAGGVVAVLARRRRSGEGAFLLGLAAFSFLAVCPGLHFRPHYFVLLLPAAALLVGAALDALAERVAARRGATTSAVVFSGALAVAVLVPLWSERAPLFTESPDEVALDTYGGNPFREAPEIARYIRDRTGPEDRVAVIGSEPEIYFYAHRKPATGYVYTYPLMEAQPLAERMSREMAREIEDANPPYVVLVTSTMSWLRHADSPGAIFDWALGFVGARYEVCAVVESAGTRESHTIWNVPAGLGRNVGAESLAVARRVR